jgi:hypothetical protein
MLSGKKITTIIINNDHTAIFNALPKLIIKNNNLVIEFHAHAAIIELHASAIIELHASAIIELHAHAAIINPLPVIINPLPGIINVQLGTRINEYTAIIYAPTGPNHHPDNDSNKTSNNNPNSINTSNYNSNSNKTGHNSTSNL